MIKDIIMTHISEEEEKALDDGKDIMIRRGKLRVKVPKDKVYAYGEIDFKTGSEDYETLEGMNWLNTMELCGVHILSNYDYKNNIARSDIRGGRWYDTTNVAQVCQFKHGQLGKPKRTIIFRLLHAR